MLDCADVFFSSDLNVLGDGLVIPHRHVLPHVDCAVNHGLTVNHRFHHTKACRIRSSRDHKVLRIPVSLYSI